VTRRASDEKQVPSSVAALELGLPQEGTLIAKIAALSLLEKPGMQVFDLRSSKARRPSISACCIRHRRLAPQTLVWHMTSRKLLISAHYFA